MKETKKTKTSKRDNRDAGKRSLARRLRLASLALVLSPLLWGACNGVSHETNQTAKLDKGLAQGDSLAYTETHFKDFSAYFTKNEEGTTDSTIYEAVYPIFSDSVQALVRDAIFINGEENVMQAASNFLDGFNEFAEDVIEGGTGDYGRWYSSQVSRVKLNTGHFLTLATEINEYTGGAHDILVELWFNYDLRTKKKLALTDLIQDTTEFRRVVEQHFRKHEGIADTSAYGEAYFFDKDYFVLADNFGFTKRGMVFHYNVYEIKAYSEGPTTLLISYAELAQFWTETGKDLLKSISPKS